MNLPDIRIAPLTGTTVLLRADLNVPLIAGKIADDSRIVRAAKTIAYLTQSGARVVVMAHLDRPRGVANPVLTIAPIAEALSDELNQSVRFVPDSVGATAERWTRTLPEGGIALLENLRFHAEEEQDDRSFAMMLSVHGDLYVNDAPACSIRSHASIHAIVPLMPAFAGPQLLAHVATLNEVDAMAMPGVEALVTKFKILENS